MSLDWTQLLTLIACSTVLLAGGVMLLTGVTRFADGSLPYPEGAEGAEEYFKSPKKIALTITKGVLGVALVCALGLFFVDRIDLKAFSLVDAKKSFLERLTYIIFTGAGFGLSVAIVFDALSVIFFGQFHRKWVEDCQFNRWRTYCGAALFASVSEELVFRLVLLSGFYWAFETICPTYGFWPANLTASLLMAATHLPIVGAVAPLNFWNRAKLIGVIAPVSMILGYAYWNFGLEVAISAHAIGLLLSWLFWAIVHRINIDYSKRTPDA